MCGKILPSAHLPVKIHTSLTDNVQIGTIYLTATAWNTLHAHTREFLADRTPEVAFRLEFEELKAGETSAGQSSVCLSSVRWAGLDQFSTGSERTSQAPSYRWMWSEFWCGFGIRSKLGKVGKTHAVFNNGEKWATSVESRTKRLVSRTSFNESLDITVT